MKLDYIGKGVLVVGAILALSYGLAEMSGPSRVTSEGAVVALAIGIILLVEAK